MDALKKANADSEKTNKAWQRTSPEPYPNHHPNTTSGMEECQESFEEGVAKGQKEDKTDKNQSKEEESEAQKGKDENER